MLSTNAEASSSRPQYPTLPYKPSQVDRQRNGVTPRGGAGVPPSLASRRSSTSKVTDGAQRMAKVRTVPPSAAFDPPSPTDSLENLDPTPHPHAPDTARTPKPKRPKPRLRYSTSSSGTDLEDDTDSEDDEPPWWIFTSKGMAKVRARTMGIKSSSRRDKGAEEHEPNGFAATSVTGSSAGPPILGPPIMPRWGRDPGRSASGQEQTDSELDSGPSRRKYKRAESWRGAVSRKSSKEAQTPSQSQSQRAQNDSPLPPPSLRGLRKLSDSPSRLHPPRLFPSHASSRLFRRKSPQNSDVPADEPSVPIPRRLQRSNSAPGSPVPVLETGPPIMSMTAPERPLSGPVEAYTDTEAVPRRKPRMSRLSSTPALAFVKRRSATGEILTDSEAHMLTSPRMRASQAKRIPPVPSIHDSPSSMAEDSRSGTPHLASRRSAKFKLALPPPLHQHRLPISWPHAGSWQDALYGNYQATPAGNKDERRMETGYSTPRARHESSSDRPHTVRRSTSGRRSSQGTHTHAKDHHHQHVNGHASVPGTPRRGDEQKGKPPGAKRSKMRRKRYRPAMSPPTPRGLGFTPADERDNPLDPSGAAKEARFDDQTHRADGFDWGDPPGPNGRNGRIEEGDELARMETRATTTAVPTEKSESLKRKGGAAGGGTIRRNIFGRAKREGKVKRKVDIDDRVERWKRYLFLDARVTIYIRAVNLIAVTILLALSITIRLELHALQLPGVIGPSTTLTIAYAAFTMLHILTAIFREYTGRPIGLWDLPSKMLWVCLDLVFIAIWSSAMSLAINDYIATPLDCTKDSPWWTHGLEGNYERLLEGLSAARVISGSASVHSQAGWTPADQIAQTLGITLPDEVIGSGLAREACRRQAASIALSLLTLLLYGGNMVLSLFRIFETVRRTSDLGRAVMV